MSHRLLFLCLMAYLPCYAYCQKKDSLYAIPDKADLFSTQLLDKIARKSQEMSAGLDKRTLLYLKESSKKDAQFLKAFANIDPAAAAKIPSGESDYKSYAVSIEAVSGTGAASLPGEYIPYSDSLRSGLAFLSKYSALHQLDNVYQDKLKRSVNGYDALVSKLKVADQAKAYVNQRRQVMKDLVARYAGQRSLKKYLDAYNKDAYYYSAQVRELKASLNDPDKIMKSALTLFNKFPGFHPYMKKYGQLAGLFGLSADYGSAAGLEGLQSKAQVKSLLQGQIAGGGAAGSAAFQSTLESAHQGMNQLKEKVSKLGAGSEDMDMPAFKPNNQKAKSFLRRLEIGTNMQTTKANYFFPSTTDIGLSIGYKVTDRNTLGIGGSYKIGWGKSISHMHLSNEGVSVRSFLDVKIKKGFYGTGGLEYNYQPAAGLTTQISSACNWTQSGLLGVGKEVKMPGKMIKKSKVCLLWDFLSYKQLPKTQPLKFRIGYGF